MAKNTGKSAFRKIKVEDYDEDAFKEDDLSNQTGSVQLANEGEVQSLLNQYPFLSFFFKLQITLGNSLELS